MMMEMTNHEELIWAPIRFNKNMKAKQVELAKVK